MFGKRVIEHFQDLKVVGKYGRCGPEFGAKCGPGLCCSSLGWCDTTEQHCCSLVGEGQYQGDGAPTCKDYRPQPTPAPAPAPEPAPVQQSTPAPVAKVDDAELKALNSRISDLQNRYNDMTNRYNDMTNKYNEMTNKYEVANANYNREKENSNNYGNFEDKARQMFSGLQELYRNRLDLLTTQQALLEKQDSLINSSEKRIKEQEELIEKTGDNVHTKRRILVYDEKDYLKNKRIVMFLKIAILILGVLIIYQLYRQIAKKA